MDFDSEEWADVEPIPQDDGPKPVVPIAYTPEFSKAHDYFRAILAADERSARALKLSRHIIDLNPANYTAWHFRRNCLLATGADLTAELAFMSEAITESPKNYQVWNHRRFLVTELADGSRELAFTKLILEIDAKNYHAWSHRLWAVKHFSLWGEELAYVEELLDADVRNNSAWNYRWFVIENTTKFTPEVRAKEVLFAVEKIKIAVHNESPWNYLNGLLRDQNLTGPLYTTLFNACRALAESPETRSPPLLALLVDHAVQSGDFVEALSLCKALETEVDTMRKRYWVYRAAQIEAAQRESHSDVATKDGTGAGAGAGTSAGAGAGGGAGAGAGAGGSEAPTTK